MAFFRGMDATTGRWMQVDPKAELMYGYTPYNAMGNNPVLHTDPNGDVLPAIAVAAIIGGAVGGVGNVIAQWDNINQGGFSLGKAAGAFDPNTGRTLGQALWHFLIP